MLGGLRAGEIAWGLSPFAGIAAVVWAFLNLPGGPLLQVPLAVLLVLVGLPLVALAWTQIWKAWVWAAWTGLHIQNHLRREEPPCVDCVPLGIVEAGAVLAQPPRLATEAEVVILEERRPPPRH